MTYRCSCTHGSLAETGQAVQAVRAEHRVADVVHCDAGALELQINTTVCGQTVGKLPALADQVARFGAVLLPPGPQAPISYSVRLCCPLA